MDRTRHMGLTIYFRTWNWTFFRQFSWFFAGNTRPHQQQHNQAEVQNKLDFCPDFQYHEVFFRKCNKDKKIINPSIPNNLVHSM